MWADVTEFTLAMEASENVMAASTLAWVDRCVQGWLADLKGIFLQQAGDAVLLAFDAPPHALEAAQRLRHDWQLLAPGQLSGWGRELRVALHWGQVRRGSQGFVSHSLNQLARLAQEVVPGQVWASAEFWQQMPPDRQSRTVDLGLMHFRHLEGPLHVFRVWPEHAAEVAQRGSGRSSHSSGRSSGRTGRSIRPASSEASNLPLPRLAVQCSPGQGAWDWSQTIADTAANDRSVDLAVLAPGSNDPTQVFDSLQRSGADYLLWRAPVQDGQCRVSLWAASQCHEIDAWTVVADASPGWDAQLWRSARVAWQRHALARAQSQPPQALSTGLLAFAAIQLMYAGQLRDFEQAHQLLAAWQERHRRSARPHVWRVLWQVMRHTRGLSGADTESAWHHVRQALRLEPEHAHAWAARGFAQGHLRGDAQAGLRDLERAQALQPDLPWIAIYRATLNCLNGDERLGLRQADQALIRPMPEALDAYALGVAGHTAVFAGQTALGLRWLESSWRGHRFHSPTLRMLVVAHQMMGHGQTARLFLRELLLLEPGLTARNYVTRSRAAYTRRMEMAHWLIEAGLPLK